jgi:acetylornithine/succinyldiaminopimelate/putrescine aminotransferase
MAGAVGFLTVLEHEPHLLQEAEKKGKLIESLLTHPSIKEIRRKGLMFAIEFEHADQVQQIVMKALEEGLLTFWFLSCPESFRLAPPLTISEEEIKESISKLNKVMYEVL